MMLFGSCIQRRWVSAESLTTSKALVPSSVAPVTTSKALVPSSFLLLLVRHLLLLAWHLLLSDRLDATKMGSHPFQSTKIHSSCLENQPWLSASSIL